MTTKEKTTENIDNGIARDKFTIIMFEFLDTLNKIKELKNVKGVYFTKDFIDIYVLLEKEDVDLAEFIMEKFSLWEASYKLFPEFHIINKDERFYIPSGSYTL